MLPTLFHSSWSLLTYNLLKSKKKSAAFNQDVYIDFLAAQVKTLSFLAYVVKIYQDLVERHATDLVQGMMNLLINCPSYVTNMRKEFFIAARHILGTPEIRPKFVDVVESLCDESILVGQGYTVRDSLRPLAYSTLADLTHHIRTDLDLHKISQAVNLFGRNMHDDSLPVSIQTMSLKLVLNLVECIRNRSEAEANPMGRQLLIKILKICVLKCKVLVKYALPALEAKCIKEPQDVSKSEKPKSSEGAIKSEDKAEEERPTIQKLQKREEEKVRPISSLAQSQISLTDFRNFAKSLVSGMKTVVVNLTSCKTGAPDGQAKQFSSKDVRVFVKFFKYAFRMFDVYMITQKDGQMHMRSANCPVSKTSDEKSIMEHLASTFSLLSAISFREVIVTVIDYFVEGAKRNVYHHSCATNLMVNLHTSPIFADILLTYLVERMDKIGDGTEESALYMKLFKICFSSVSCAPKENENMMKVHLKKIVLGSMECCLTSKEPSHYMYLLRALFRSIGGGSHEQLYREFFPLLPRMLTILNNLLRSPHRAQVRDLLGELCVIVPVRLSTLLPYLDMLMEPLVHVLNCNTVNQGLRTMELCVDNMQPDFLYDHLYSVRGDMLLALYNSLRSSQDSVAQMAYKVLGKLGPHNRAHLPESQRLSLDPTRGQEGPAVTIRFQENSAHQVDVPVRKLVAIAVEVLQDSSADQYTKERAWSILHGYLCSVLQSCPDSRLTTALFHHSAFKEGSLANLVRDPDQVCDSGSSWQPLGAAWSSEGLFTPPQSAKTSVECDVLTKALTGIFIGTLNEPLRSSHVGFISFIVRHFTLVSIAQQVSPCVFGYSGQQQTSYLDANLLIDALMGVMAHENKDLVRVSSVYLKLVHSTALLVMGSSERVARLPLFAHLAVKTVELFYSNAWYAKGGGCATVQCLLGLMHVSWLRRHLLSFLRGLLYVLHGLTGQISQGAVKMAKEATRQLLTATLAPQQDVIEGNDEVNERCRLAKEVCGHLVTCLMSDNSTIRDEAECLLSVTAQLMSWTLTEAVGPHQHLLAHVTPPAGEKRLRHYPVSHQIAILKTNYFLSHHKTGANLLRYSLDNPDHEAFINDLRHIMETSEEGLLKQGCYNRQEESLVPLQIVTCQVLSTLWYLEVDKNKTFTALFKGICSDKEALHEPAYRCLKEYATHTGVDMEVRHSNVKPILTNMRTWEALKVTTLKQISYCAQLFPSTFSERLCESLQSHLNNLLEDLIKKFKETLTMEKVNIPIMPHCMEICIHVVGLFHMIPSASPRFIPNLCAKVLKAEREMHIEPSSPLRYPLLKFLLRYPKETFALFLTDPEWLPDTHAHRFLIYALSHEEGGRLREYLKLHVTLLLDMLQRDTSPPLLPDTDTQSEGVVKLLSPEDAAVRYLAVKMIHVFYKKDREWLVSCAEFIPALLTYWLSEPFKEKHANLNATDYDQWNEPKLILDCFTAYFDVHRDDLDLLFHMVPGVAMRSVASMHRFRDFLANMADTWPGEWKRRVFLRAVELYRTHKHSDQQHYHVFNLIILPCFLSSLERGEHEAVLGGKPRPNHEADDDVVSVFINVLIGDTGGTTTAVRVMYYQLACLLIEYAPQYIHDINSKKQGVKIRRILNFAWPSVSSNFAVVDLQEKYSGLQLLAHLISKFNIAKKITVQVFHCLAKGTHTETKKIVNPSLDVLIPAWLSRTDDPTPLVQGTKKIMNEDQGIISSLHVITIIIRHADIYYPVRGQLIPMIIATLKRLANQTQLPADQRRMILDMIETMVRWDVKARESINIKVEESGDATTSDAKPPVELVMEKSQREHLANLMVRFTCQAVEPTQTGSVSAEVSARRSLNLLEATLQPDLWGDVDLKLDFLDRFLDPANNPTMICMTLEIIKTLFTVLPKPMLLANVKYFSKAFCGCLKGTKNLRVIKFCCGVVKAMLTKFPAEPPNKQKITTVLDLAEIYTTISKVIMDTFDECEETRSPAQQEMGNSLQSVFHLLLVTQQVQQNNFAFVDRCIVQLVGLVKKLKEHITPGQSAHPDNNTTHVLTDILINGLDLIKSRLNVITPDMRRSVMEDLQFMIEKSRDNPKLIKAIISILKEWVNVGKSGEHFAPSGPEKAKLFSRLWHVVSQRTDTPEIMRDLLEAVYLLYTKDTSRNAIQYRKLDVAFCYGLRSGYPLIRQRYIDLYLEGSALKRNSSLFTRILFLLCTSPWDEAHWKDAYWISTFLEVLLCDVDNDFNLQLSSPGALLPSPDYVIPLLELSQRQSLTHAAQAYPRIEEKVLPRTKLESTETTSDEAMDTSSTTPTTSSEDKDGPKPSSEATNEPTIPVIDDPEVQALLRELTDGSGVEKEVSSSSATTPLDLSEMLTKHCTTLSTIKQTTSNEFVRGMLCLSYRSNELTGSLFADMWPRLWRLLTLDQQVFVSPFLRRFLASEVHFHTSDQQPSPIATLLEGVIRSGNIAPSVPDVVLTYLAMTYNQWHRICLLLEDYSISPPVRLESSKSLTTSTTLTASQGCVVSSSEVPTGDLGSTGGSSAGAAHGGTGENVEGEAKFPVDYNLSLIVLYEKMREEDYLCAAWARRAPEHREMIQALVYAQQGMYHQAAEMATDLLDRPTNSPTNDHLKEERNRYKFIDYTIDYLKQLNQWETLSKYAQSTKNHHLLADAEWRRKEWSKVLHLCSTNAQEVRVEAWRHSLMHSYARLMLDGAATGSQGTAAIIDVDKIITHITQDWRRLPRVISNQHIPVLQACHRSVELHESSSLFMHPTRTTYGTDLKSTIKTWRNRLPLITDDLTFWSDVITWRQLVYQRLADIPDINRQMASYCQSESCHFNICLAKACRKQHLPLVAYQHLDNVFSRPNIAQHPNVAFEKAKQEFKLKLGDFPKKEDLVEGLELMEKHNIRGFHKSEKAKFFSYKAVFFSMLNKGDEATKNFGYAIQMDDDLHKVWSGYGDFLENVFSNYSAGKRNAAVSTTGLFAMQALMEAAAIAKQPEWKARGHIAKCLWLLTLDDPGANTLAGTLVQRSTRIKSDLLLAWIPNLVAALMRPEGRIVAQLLSRLGSEFPKAVYLAVRALSGELDHHQSCLRGRGEEWWALPKEGENEEISQPEILCEEILQQIISQHPSQVTALDLFSSQLSLLELHWSEHALVHLNGLLNTVYRTIFSNSLAPSPTSGGSSTGRDVSLPSHVVTAFVSLADFLTSVEDADWRRTPSSESLRSQLASALRSLAGHKCQVVISKLSKRWIPALSRRVSYLPSTFFLDEKTRFLLEIDSTSTKIDLPGDLCQLKPYQHYLKLCSVAPTLRRTLRHRIPARLLTFRASNGRLFHYTLTPALPPFLISPTSTDQETAFQRLREARPHQLYRLVTELLIREREPGRRFLCLSTPRVLDVVAPKMGSSTRSIRCRLVEEMGGVSEAGHVARLAGESPCTSVTLLQLLDEETSVCTSQGDDVMCDPGHQLLNKYLDRLLACSSAGQPSHQVLRNIYREVRGSVDINLVRDWARRTTLEAEDYWLLRKRVTQSLAVIDLAEYIFHLTAMTPGKFFLDPRSGQCQANFLTFDIGDATHELEANHAVPFRLSPTLHQFMTPLGERGPFVAALLATSRALLLPKHQLTTFVRCILRDDYIFWYMGRMDSQVEPKLTNDRLVQLLVKAGDAVNARLKVIGSMDGPEPKVCDVIASALSIDNLCKMDPTWHAWL